MDWLTNELLFYGGIIITAAAIVATVLHLITARLRAALLKERLRTEYGNIEK